MSKRSRIDTALRVRLAIASMITIVSMFLVATSFRKDIRDPLSPAAATPPVASALPAKIVIDHPRPEMLKEGSIAGTSTTTR